MWYCIMKKVLHFYVWLSYSNVAIEEGTQEHMSQFFSIRVTEIVEI